jgi:hypothetical protein
MGANHDILADKAGRAIINKIITQEERWSQVFSTNIRKAGDFSWPRPDYVCYDYDLDQSIAFEFKPPGFSKREYITGLGQTFSYLEKHHYSGLILPNNVEGFNIAEYISQILSLDVFSKQLISVIGYDESIIESDPQNAITLYKSIDDVRTGEIVSNNLSQTYWCWWRDISHYEVFQLLCLLDIHNVKTGDIYSDYVWPEFWQLLCNGQTQNWEGIGREKTDNITNSRSEKQNYKIPLFQLGLIEQSEGRLTVDGYKLVAIGKIYGINSAMYIDYLTKIVLIEGKHLILIQDLERFKNETNVSSFESQDKFRIEFELFLENNNSIGNRKPGRTTTGNKISYIRDEFKLWNKLKLLKNNGSRYFINGVGIEFDWNRITDILTKDFIF